ncbi:hypothetical protein [Azospirillum picis]|uniref:DUF2802 domain-containing protein n=1 Tax=Azospirillum picis TaxID=488438 RepID=A0ABU0MKW2_9PROT|nr:hypothetical protein [Azospirillum picis]MBP2300319.1 hypothetical protein [Azospirillum picis]MDQ0534115.1 hypothetical protein [Azospirillum picis]
MTIIPMPTNNPLLLLIELVILIALLSWTALSAIQAGRRVATVGRCRRKLDRDRAETATAIESLRGDQRRIEGELQETAQSLEVRQAEVADLQATLKKLKLDGPREYRLLSERFGDGDRLFLLTIPRTGPRTGPQDDRPDCWAVAAADSGAAMALLAKTVPSPERPALNGQLD